MLPDGAGGASSPKPAFNVNAVPAVPATATGLHPKPTATPKVFKHPLDPLTADEIAAISHTIRVHATTQKHIKSLTFITCDLVPPPKRTVLAYLGIPIEPGAKPEAPTRIVRKATSDFLDTLNGCAYNVVLDLNDNAQWVVTDITRLSETQHPQISVEELIEAENVVKNHPTIQKLAKEVGVEPHQIFCDGWSIGYDDRFPQHRRVQQALTFAPFSEHDNLYAHPFDFVPVIDCHTGELLHVGMSANGVSGTGELTYRILLDFPAVYVNASHKTTNAANNEKATHELTLPHSGPPVSIPTEDVEKSLKASNRERIPVPRTAWDFLPDLMAKTEEGFKQRSDLKPLHVVQPEGVSFKADGHVLEWQNWKMHIAFTHREGIALSTITYNDHGVIRPIFYRLSLAEMVVPYGVPEHPHPRKFAFDSGEYGMGTMANELSLGCDCLGQIHYMPGCFVAHNGSAMVIKNVICIHEEDNGVLWKHTDYRPNGRSQTVRRRRLVVSMVCTLANYEYIWNYHFYQDGSIEFEIRLTGILSVFAVKDGEPTPFGTKVAPNINAHFHQHFFSVRVDPMIDGLKNTVIESDIIPLEAPTGSAENYAGNAFTQRDTPVAMEGGSSFDYAKDRRWRIVNRGKKHYSSQQYVGYTLGVKGGATPMMSKEDGWAAKRAKFLTNTVWVVKDVEQQDEKKGTGTTRMWPAGKYVPQTREEPEDSVGQWVKGGLDVVDEDLLVFLTLGTTHIPRPEDWPVMPAENIVVHFKPNSFFKANPSMDVPGSKDPLSVAAFKDKVDSPSCCKNGQHAS
ncbi:peroxisomal copper amine oxidase [Crepidotus variabilis]|uniref:Amine oxidase n=1 Tax=Crepidotus variabilis TaxID=179855 RepID=A0A9P6EV10_9AGAR|nr:peroxisomal copper amine oxidase [Crepidotus variabilis]